MPLADQHAQSADGQHREPDDRACGYFAPLANALGPAGSVPPQLQDLLHGSGATGRLQTALLLAAVQRAGVLHQRWQHLLRTCPVTLLPGAEEHADQEAAERQPTANCGDSMQEEQQQRQRQQVESELRVLASFIAAAAAAEAGGAAAGPDNKECAGLATALESLQIVQQWAEEAHLQQLLQACLRSAADASGAAERRRGLCRSLLLHSDLLEHHRLAALLPAAAAAELRDAFR